MAEPLWLHPFSSVPGATRVEVQVDRRGATGLALRYVVHGAKALRIPGLAERRRVDGLWQSTCLELFVRAADGGYYEINFSPSSEWAAYRFDGYRKGMQEADIHTDVRVDRTGDRLAMIALITLPEDAVGPLAISAVLEDLAGDKSYWALAHGPGKPDFHHPDSFALELPAPEHS